MKEEEKEEVEEEEEIHDARRRRRGREASSSFVARARKYYGVLSDPLDNQRRRRRARERWKKKKEHTTALSSHSIRYERSVCSTSKRDIEQRRLFENGIARFRNAKPSRERNSSIAWRAKWRSASRPSRRSLHASRRIRRIRNSIPNASIWKFAVEAYVSFIHT